MKRTHMPVPTGEGGSLESDYLSANVAVVDPGAIFRELWEVNGPYEESWMGPWNAEIWRDSNDWRNDATGHPYDD
jgi:hypothetical protein